MEALKIWLFCIGTAVCYGIIHDQVTVRICLEYFSVFHPTILPLKSPTLLALQWGIVATWWVGAILGVLLATAARAGSRVPLPASDLRRPIAILLLCMAAGAFLAGIAGFVLARNGLLSLRWLDPMLSPDRQPRFMADWWAHSASYLVGIVGGLAVCIRTYARRWSAKIS